MKSKILGLKTGSRALRLWAFLSRPWVVGVLSVVVALLVYGLILANRSPNLLRPLSMELRTGVIIIPVVAVVLYLVFRIPGWLGSVLGLTLTMVLFALGLAGIWASGQTQHTVINGLVPLADASEYYTDALRLLAGQDFDVISAHRPLFPGLLAVLLAITGRNLMAALGLLVAITAGACYLVAREVQRTHGAEAAVFVLIVLYLFYRYHSGTVMTENLGVALGALGFALLWRGAAERGRWLVLLGLFVSTLALNARAGAFLVLPAMLIWASRLFRGLGRCLSWRFLVAGAGVIVAGFALNLLLVRLLATPSGVPFGSFAYVLYGMAAGGKGWHYVLEVHPELLNMQDPELTRRMYQLAFDLIRQEPSLLIKGVLYSWGMLFSESSANLYAYVGGENVVANLFVHWGLYLLCILGFLKWIFKPGDPFACLVGFAALGVLASAPFLPPTDAYRMRPYAASIVILGLLPAMGLALVLERLKAGFFYKPYPECPGRGVTVWYSLMLVLAVVAGPLVVKGLEQLPRLEPASCAVGEDSLVIRVDAGASINVIPDRMTMLDWVPNIHRILVRRNAHILSDTNMIQWLVGVNSRRSLFYALDYRTYRKALLVVYTDLLPEPGAIVELCGAWERTQKLKTYNIFYANTVRLIMQ